MSRTDLINSITEHYMNNLLDYPDIVRDALAAYFENCTNDELEILNNINS